MGTIILAAIVVAVFWKPAFHIFRIAVDEQDEYHGQKIREWAQALKSVVAPTENMSGPPSKKDPEETSTPTMPKRPTAKE